MIRFCNNFTKITGWPVQKLVFRTRILYEDRSIQGRRINGPAIIISNHTSVFDFACYMFVFFTCTIRCLIAEVLLARPVLKIFLRMLGCIPVNRNTHDFSFINKSLSVLEQGGVIEIFPESRIPRKEEARPLEFKNSAAYIALQSGARIIPVYTNGAYFTRKRAGVLIGTPMYVKDYIDAKADEKTNIVALTRAMRRRIIELEKMYNERVKEK